MAGSCEYGNEHPCSIKCVEFLCWITICQLLKNCSMKLVVNWFNTITRRYIVYASLNKINIIPTSVTNGNCLSCPLRSHTLFVLRHYPHHWQTEAFQVIIIRRNHEITTQTYLRARHVKFDPLHKACSTRADI